MRVLLVNKKDQKVGLEEKLAAHQRGLLHRAFSIFIFRKTKNKLELLLQQREISKYHSGGLWTNTCCSHPHPGKPLLLCARDRLVEEMGVKATLIHVGSFHYHADVGNGLFENELDHLFIGYISREKISPNPNEVQDYRWVGLTDLEKELEESPEKFTVWLPIAYKKLRELKKKILIKGLL